MNNVTYLYTALVALMLIGLSNALIAHPNVGPSTSIPIVTSNTFPNPSNYIFTGQVRLTNGSSNSIYNVTLNWTKNMAIENLPSTVYGTKFYGTKLYHFWTNDPYYSCLNGATLNLWTNTNYYPNAAFVVHNGWQGSQCVYITLTYP